MDKVKNLKGKLLLSLIALSLFSCKKNQLQVLSSETIGIIDYNESNTYDTKIAFSNSYFLIMNYNLGHSDFYPSSSTLKLFDKGKKVFEKEEDVNKIDNLYNKMKDSLNLNLISVSDFVSHNTLENESDFSRVKLSVDTYIELHYDDNRGTKLTIDRSGKQFEQNISTTTLPNAPTLNFYDVNGDNIKDVFIFYPSTDYWDSESYNVTIYDISSFL